MRYGGDEVRAFHSEEGVIAALLLEPELADVLQHNERPKLETAFLLSSDLPTFPCPQSR
jgi:hypothetical protein